jgi:uncharacterized RDD family membrane protein YckC
LGLTTLLRALKDGETRTPLGDRRFRILAAAALPVYLTVMYWPLTADFFALTQLSLSQWGGVLPIVGGAYLVLWLSDR